MSEARAATRKSTPWHLWAVGIISLLWNAMGALDYVMTETKNDAYMGQFSSEQLEYFYGLPTWFIALWAIAVWGGVLGSLLLLVRKRLAVGVFTVSFAAMVCTTIYSYGFSNGLEVMGGAGPVIFTAVIFLVCLALVLYSRWMRKCEVLV